MIQLQEKERILLLRRRHWLILVFGIARVVILGVLLAAGLIWSLIAYPELFAGYGGFVLLGAALFSQVLWILFFLILTDYYLDAWVITNNRLVFIELHGLFSRSVTSIDFGRIQDVTIQVFGFLPTVFKYGNIKIFTAGNEAGFTFKDVPHPYELKDELLAIREKILKGETQQANL
jgi:uncharacterized membrane protein YdbT with pleckstrin-like domain